MSIVMLMDEAGEYYQPRRRRPTGVGGVPAGTVTTPARAFDALTRMVANYRAGVAERRLAAYRQRHADLCLALLGDAQVYRSHRDYGMERRMLVKALVHANSAVLPTGDIYAALAICRVAQRRGDEPPPMVACICAPAL